MERDDLGKVFEKLINYDWLREDVGKGRNVSNCWRCLLDSLSLIKDRLAWRLGNGLETRVRRDLIVGATNFYWFFEELVSVLHSRKNYYLYQVRKLLNLGLNRDNWLKANEIGLMGNLALEWENFIKD